MKKKILIIFGTRPEAIKVFPVINELNKNKKYFDLKICLTGQHKQMLNQVLDFFEIKPHININVMRKNQNLEELTSNIITKISSVIKKIKPDLVLVHGDTTSSFAASIASFYNKVKVAHIEAGLRTNNLYSPWPEEINRSLISKIAQIHFAPTLIAKKNLEIEGINRSKIIVTGNTVIDSLFITSNKIFKLNSIKKRLEKKFSYIKKNKRMILVTGHRRENFEKDFENIFKALKYVAERNKEIIIIYPVHLNPKVLLPAKKILGKVKNIKLIKPLDYISFIYLMHRSYLIITDSGGIQEEAPSLKIPVLVTRKNSERPEALKIGSAKLVGTNSKIIIKNIFKLLNNKREYKKMIIYNNPYGNGKAAKKIVNFLKKKNF